MPLLRVLRALLLLGQFFFLAGCFTALSRYEGHKPSPSVAVGAAAADIVTAPVQLAIIPPLLIEDAARKRDEPERVARAAAAAAVRKAEEERVMAVARLIQERLDAEPELLTSDAFWDEYAGEKRAQSIALGRAMRRQDRPVPPEITAYLLGRFPEHVHGILGNGRVPHDELCAMVLDITQDYKVRDVAIGTLVRDRSFDFGEPWRTILIHEFQLHLGALFGTDRYTRAELLALSRMATIDPSVRAMAEENLRRANAKPEASTGLAP